MASFNNGNDAPPLNNNDITIIEDEESDEELSESSEEFNFAATLQLRKNLTETFDKHIHSNSVTQKIAHLEQRTVATASQKPPRQQLPKSSGRSKGQCLSVYLRVRPLPTTGEHSKTAVNTVEILEPSSSTEVATTIRTYPPNDSNAAKVVRDTATDGNNPKGGIKEFQFQHVFSPESTQKDLYTTVAAPMVHGLFPDPSDPKSLVGKSALLFAYGITNAGKTHTVMGDVGKLHKKNKAGTAAAAPYAKWGIVPRALHDIFAKMSSNTQQKYNLHLSYMEIYNEHIFDLLPKEKKGGGGAFHSFAAPSGPLRLREGHYGDTFVRGLTKHRVRDVTHALELAEKAQMKRHTSSNNLNSDSSRSHCICQLELSAVTDIQAAVANDDNDSVASSSGYNTDEEASQISKRKHKTVTMWIVDLAGSERSKRTGFNVGARQKEAALINASLMKLMRCLSVMRGNQAHSNSRDVIPYRESKLTHLFMNHLSGKAQSRTCMIVNINPASTDFDETQHVLSYAVAAKSVQISEEDYMKKRKAMDASLNMDVTHGYDGRSLHPLPEAKRRRPNKIARLVKKFSPKKFSPKRVMQKRAVAAGQRVKNAQVKPGEAKKRKAELLSLRGAAAVPVPGLEATIVPKAKMARLAEEADKSKHLISHPGTKVDADEKELASLKTALMIAQAEVETLKFEKSELEDEISQIEEQVRMEVAEEMDEQMLAMREQYNSTIDRLKLQIQKNPTPGRSVRKARADKAEQAIEELIDKVDECEEEMVRMREVHEEEIAKLEQDHREEVQAKDEEIQVLKSIHAGEMQAQKAELEQLKLKLENSMAEIKELKKSKQESFDGQENNTREEESAGMEDRVTANDAENVPVQGLMRSSSKNKPTGEVLRAPLSSISNKWNSYNEGDDPLPSDGDEDDLLYPRKPTLQDEDGTYQRPRGRAPSGREWDAESGAWRLSMA